MVYTGGADLGGALENGARTVANYGYRIGQKLHLWGNGPKGVEVATADTKKGAGINSELNKAKGQGNSVNQTTTDAVPIPALSTVVNQVTPDSIVLS